MPASLSLCDISNMGTILQGGTRSEVIAELLFGWREVKPCPPRLRVAVCERLRLLLWGELRWGLSAFS